MAGGRPSKYNAQLADQAKELCKLGATIAQLSDAFKVTQSTIKLWAVQHEEFSASLKLGRDVADDRVEQSLYHRAMGYSHEESDIRVINNQIVITPITKHYPPDTTACIFWLKNRRPEQYRANPEDSQQKDDIVAVLGKLIDKLPD